ncbi:hypothetical protein HZA75_05540 [Candidatus Roizmanbacteria bacterium]|nr:hypothetical protein [Candidatus Roizmanbacteria bacterium]
MTLHQTVEIAKKVLLATVVGIAGVILLILFFRFGIILKNLILPPKTLPANNLYNTLKPIKFSPSTTNAKLTYNINTVTGTLPDFPERVNIFPILQPQPNLLDLNKARTKAGNVGFVDGNNNVLPEKALNSTIYEWDEAQDLQRKLVINTLTTDFSLTSGYLSSATIINSSGSLTIDQAITAVVDFLNHIGFVQSDLDMSKVANPNQEISYFRTPQLLAIENGVLAPTASLATTQIIRVDLYQKDIEYTLNTGIPELTGGYKTLKIKIPVLYPNPPHSTMSFWVAAGELSPQIVAADFAHKNIDTSAPEATYSIKTPSEAFNELKEGKAYIASFTGPNTNISINNAYLAYYMGKNDEPYLMPIIVFTDNNGFFAYVSAVKNEWVK